MQSAEGEGSTFTLYLPDRHRRSEKPSEPRLPVPAEPAEPLEVAPRAETAELPPPLTDDRGQIVPGDRIALVMTEDRALAHGTVEVANEHGFKCLLAVRGDAGLGLVHEFMPHAVVLSKELPQVAGDAVLDHLKRHPETRHIPVYVLAARNGERDARLAGALGCMSKPISAEGLAQVFAELEAFLDRRERSVLVIEDDPDRRKALTELVGGVDVKVVAADSREAAFAELDSRSFDCVVLDLGLADGEGFGVLEKVKRTKRFRRLPVIVHSRRELDAREQDRLDRFTQALVVKDARSPERLLDETSLYLHRAEARLPAEKRQMLERLHTADEVFEGKKVLIVDDDVRNVFALTSVFERRGMEVLFAENGRDGLEALKRNPDVALVLMDIMMPEMDGYEATRAVRGIPEFEQLPIVALTAKAMKGDREKSIASGASDYITKPVDVDQLLSLMRVWLHR